MPAHIRHRGCPHWDQSNRRATIDTSTSSDLHSPAGHSSEWPRDLNE
jgi:hypothetical protein